MSMNNIYIYIYIYVYIYKSKHCLVLELTMNTRKAPYYEAASGLYPELEYLDCEMTQLLP